MLHVQVWWVSQIATVFVTGGYVTFMGKWGGSSVQLDVVSSTRWRVTVVPVQVFKGLPRESRAPRFSILALVVPVFWG